MSADGCSWDGMQCGDDMSPPPPPADDEQSGFCTPCAVCGAGTWASTSCNATMDTECSPCPTVTNAAQGAQYICHPFDGTGSRVSACASGFFKVSNPGATAADTCTACSSCAPGTYGSPCLIDHDRVCTECTPVTNGEGALTCESGFSSRVEGCSSGYVLIPGNETHTDVCAPMSCPIAAAVPFTPDPDNPPLCDAGGHSGGAGFMQACEAETGCMYASGQCTLKTVSPQAEVTSGTESVVDCGTWESDFIGEIVLTCELGELAVDRNTCVLWERSDTESIGLYSTMAVQGDIASIGSSSMRAEFELAFGTYTTANFASKSIDRSCCRL
jgi:hypothetical protein